MRFTKGLFLFLILLASFFPSLAQSGEEEFVLLNSYTDRFAFDMRYATENNFLKEKAYPCANCLVRSEVAEALLKAAELFAEKGYTILFYDCFRPVDVQKKMWAILPNSKYVANPNTSGSIHNRGAAVDITLVDAEGTPLDMGTSFDHFGPEAHHGFNQLSEEAKKNRILLKSIMEQCGFTPQSTEWWHYNFGERGKYPISNEVLCR